MLHQLCSSDYHKPRHKLHTYTVKSLVPDLVIVFYFLQCRCIATQFCSVVKTEETLASFYSFKPTRNPMLKGELSDTVVKLTRFFRDS